MRKMFEPLKSGRLAVVIACVSVFGSPLVLAQGGLSSLDSSASSARLFQGSAADPDAVNTGVARVAGKVKLDATALNHSAFNLSIYPANERWGESVTRDGILAAGYIPNATNDTLLTFKAERIVRTEAGQLKIDGELTLTRVDRSVNAEPSEAYAGPVYGDPVTLTTTREVTFLFENLGTPDPSTRNLSGAAHVDDRNFPELLNAVENTNWPPVIQNEECWNPSSTGEDYDGPKCTGRVIAATQTDNCEPGQLGGGEGYTGPVCMTPRGNATTIVLDLKLLYADLGPSPAPSSTATTR